MEDADDRGFFLRRAQEERDKAKGCVDRAVALAHLRLADAYDARVTELDIQIRSATGL